MKLCPKCGKNYADDANFCPVDAARLTLPPPMTSGEDPLAARFVKAERVGGATTGDVWRATDKEAGVEVAYKEIAATVTTLASVSSRIERELKQLERVNAPGVARVIGAGRRSNGGMWVATEWLRDAQPLSTVIAAQGPMAPAAAGALIAHIGEALIEAAKVGVVHRDLAPKNVLVAPGATKLINFAAPAPVNERVPGVPEYVSPEAIESKPIDQRSNIYSLGAMLYFVLTGQAPHQGDMATVHRAHLHDAIEPASSKAPGSGELDALLVRALDRVPSKRYLTVRQFVDEVVRVTAGVAGAAGAGVPAKPQAVIVNSDKAHAQTLMGVPPGGAVGIPGVNLSAAPAAPMAVVPSAPTATVPAPVAAPMPTPVEPASPWAAPAAGPMVTAPMGGAAPLATPAIVAAPVAAPVPAAPVVPAAPEVPAAPVFAVNAPAPGKGKAEPAGGNKGKFRETLWFKKGELDAVAAQAAAEAGASNTSVADKADTLPSEDRYNDDGTVSRTDKERYSLKTGATMMMPAIQEAAPAASGKVSESELIGEMKGNRSKVAWIVIAVVVVGVGALIAAVAL